MTQFLWIIEGFPTKNSATWDKKVQKSRDSLLSKIFSIPEISELQGSSYEICLVLWDKNDQQNRDTRIIQKILKPEFFWNTGGFAHDDFWRCETKKRTKLWYPFYLKTFDTRTFLKHRGVHPRCFSAIWDQKTSTEKRDTPFLSKNLFRTRNFLKDKNVPPRCFSVLWD